MNSRIKPYTGDAESWLKWLAASPYVFHIDFTDIDWGNIPITDDEIKQLYDTANRIFKDIGHNRAWEIYGAAMIDKGESDAN